MTFEVRLVADVDCAGYTAGSDSCGGREGSQEAKQSKGVHFVDWF